MPENGGGLTPGQRLERIEADISEIKRIVNERFSRHKQANEQAIVGLAKEIATVGRDITAKFEERVATLERHDTAEEAVRSYRKWLIGVGIAALGLLLGNVVMVAQVLGKIAQR